MHATRHMRCVAASVLTALDAPGCDCVRRRVVTQYREDCRQLDEGSGPAGNSELHQARGPSPHDRLAVSGPPGCGGPGRTMLRRSRQHPELPELASALQLCSVVVLV